MITFPLSLTLMIYLIILLVAIGSLSVQQQKELCVLIGKGLSRFGKWYMKQLTPP